MVETVAYSSLKHTRSRKAIAVPYFEDLKARRGCGCGWRVVLTWRMDGYMHALQISDHLRDTAGGVVMQCDIWVVFRGSISSDYKDTTRGEKQKQFFAGAMRRDTVHVFAICSVCFKCLESDEDECTRDSSPPAK